ncbi:DUF1905 domain-containing protein [Microbacterium sp. NIBRBAC000506063]|uniref:DUF1905 domain-containing protein n=1 Tax=Microbacterium sp. NIBRBAC000506063 TaxID=2734618 RepID=UPI001BB7677F|nr:DUF1905 domain-containing protein [Microbacterium sp. NIBRBAC000506063]QTV80146.1 DUF1905 domain-containing protein [Microbacterium sp. NIBRBAC000506063]
MPRFSTNFWRDASTSRTIGREIAHQEAEENSTVSFRTTLWASGGNNVGIVVPEEVVLGFDRGKRVPVVVTIDGDYRYRNTIASRLVRGACRRCSTRCAPADRGIRFRDGTSDRRRSVVSWASGGGAHASECGRPRRDPRANGGSGRADR